MTLDGTNTWMLGSAGRARPSWLIRVRWTRTTCVGSSGQAGEVARHRAHPSPPRPQRRSLSRFAELTGAGVRAADPPYASSPTTATAGCDDGQDLSTGGLSVRVLATPGHTSDSTSLLITSAAGAWLLTGDMVLGRGTTVITHPDGDLARLPGLAGGDARRRPRVRRRCDPARSRAGGHRPGGGADPLPTSTGWSGWSRCASASGSATRRRREVVARVYADVDRSVWPAAEQSVSAQLDYLRSR